MKSPLFFLSISLFTWSFSVFAQKPIWNDIILEEEINLSSLQTDTIGFVWGLSKNGLFQYDGLKLTNKIIRKDETLTYTSICRDKNHNYIIGTSSGEVIQYNPYSNKIINTHYINKLQSPITFMDCEDIDDNCLLLSYGNGLIWNSQSLDTLLTIENILISNEVYSAILKDNKVILATDQGIQIITKQGQNLSSEILNEDNGLGDVIISNIIEHDGKMLASNYDSQIYQIDTSSLSVKTFDLPVRSKINGIKIIQKNQLLIFNNDGIYTLENNSWIKKYPNAGTQEVLDITIDEENNMWVCSSGNKLSKANLQFELIPNTIDKSQAILKINNQFWIGSSEGLYIVEGLNKTKVLDKNITCLKMIEGDILVGTYSFGILILDKKGQIIGSIDGWENNPKQSVLYIYLKEKLLYISSLTGVIKMKWSKNNGLYSTSEYQNLNNQLGPGYIYQILENQGVLYFATDRQGIKILRKDSLQHITHFDNENTHTLGSIYSMTKCDAGRIWFSSSTGYIGYEENGKVYNINNERFIQDPYTSLITSADQKIIMARNYAIDIYDPQSGHYLYFNDISHSTDQELYLNSFTQDDDNIYLAKPKGVLKIEGFQNQKTYPECTINQVMVNLIDVGKKNSFSEDQNNLEFKYSAAWMTDPERITYQYILEGLDDNWRNTRDQRAVYPMLRPGKYVFKIKASVDGRFTHEQTNSFQFNVKQPFYKTWWFISLVLLFVGAAIRKWRNERKKVRLQKEDLNKKRIEAQLISLQTQLNPHFLFNSFNTLIGLIEEDPSKGITFTEKLTDFYRNILEMGKNDLIPLKDEIQLLDTYIHLIKERFGEQLQIDVLFEDIDSFKIPPLTLQLLIENAVKHNVVSSKNPLHIVIKQNGKNVTIKNKKLPKYGNSKGTGIGLENIKKRHTLNNLTPPKIEQSDEYFTVTIYLNNMEE